MSDRDLVELERARLRQLFHGYNNLAARILTRSEVALLDDDAEDWRATLEAVCKDAIDLAQFTRDARAELLGTQD